MNARWILLAALVPIASGLLWFAWQFNPPIWDVAFSPDGRTLYALCCGYDNKTSQHTSATVRVWDWKTGRQIRSTSIIPPIYGWTLSADGTKLAVLRSERQCEILDTSTLATIARLEADSAIQLRRIIQFTPSGDSVLTLGTTDVGQNAGRNWYVDAWNVATGTKISSITNNQSQPWFSDAMHVPRVIVGWRSATLPMATFSAKVYDVQGGDIVEIADLTAVNAPFAQLFPDGKKVMIHRGLTADIYDLTSSSTLRTIRVFGAPSFDYFAISPSGSLLGIIDAARNVIILDTATGRRIHRFRTNGPRNYYPNQFAFLPDEQSILSKGYDGVIRIYDLKTEKLIRQFPDFRLSLFCLIGAACFWAVAWIGVGAKLRPSWPLFDVLVLNALLFIPAQLHIVRSMSQLDISTFVPSVALAHLASLMALLVFWWVHGRIRWSVRLAGFVAGLASICGLLLVFDDLDWAAWQVVVGSVSFIALVLGSFLSQRLARLRLGNVATDETAHSTARWQWPLRDTFLLVTAVAFFVAVARYLKPHEMPTWGIIFVLSNGVTLAAVVVTAAWSALSTRSVFIRMLVLILVAAILGRGLPELFVGLPILPGWWYLSQHSVCAAVVLLTLLVYRLQGYRLRRVQVAKT